MYLSFNRLLRAVVLAAVALASGGCGGWWRSAPPSTTRAADAPDIEEDSSANIIRSLEERVRQDPQDFVALNKLGGYYLQRLRETGDVKYIDLASRTAHASSAILPVEQNAGALAVLAQVAFAAHDFAAARDHALLLMHLESRKSYPYQILGDSLLELGDYEKASEVFRQVRESGVAGVGGEARLARFELLRGQTGSAHRRLTNVLALALEEVPRSRETVAWCHWQLGEAVFSTGDYETAERHYRDALETFPGYFHALAALGRVRAARGDIASAIEQYERVVRIIPDPSFIAALGDLYKIAGRDKDAAKQYALVEQIARLSALNGALYNRQLALFYADHDLKPSEAYTLAAKEYEVRRDIYGADALAWTALKAGKLPEAQAAIKEALRLGTQDARLFYHAGMIARAAGERDAAREHLKRARALNPQFDPLQSRIVQKTVEDLQ